MQDQCDKKQMVGEAGRPLALKTNENFARTRHTRPIDSKRLSSALPAPWQPDQWLGFGKVD
jgi:hypothetical protein